MTSLGQHPNLGPVAPLTTTLSSIPSSTPSSGYFPSIWNLPSNFILDTATYLYYSVPQLPTLDGHAFNPALFVCQTNISGSGSLTSLNTWSVAQITACGETNNLSCTIQEGTTQNMTITFLSNIPGASLAGSFFICIGNVPMYINELVCDSYSPFFLIVNTTIGSSAALLKRIEIPSLTQASLMPTTTLSVSLYTPNVLITGQPSVTTPGVSTPAVARTTTVAGSATSGTSVSTTPAGPASQQGGLSTGGKAGIAIAVVLFFIILLLIIFCLFRRRKQRKSRTSEATEKPVPPNTHELLTNANSHELFTKHNVPEMDQQDGAALKVKAKLVPVITDTRPGNERKVLREDLAVHELDPESHITALGAEDYFPSTNELETSDLRQEPISLSPERSSDVPGLHERGLDIIATSRKDEPPLINEERERKVELLKDRIDRIREEKERLERIQHLKDLEEQTKREILEASRHT